MLELVTQFTENYLNKKMIAPKKLKHFFATKAVQSIPLRHRFVIDFWGNSSIAFLHPLSRLVPIKALSTDILLASLVGAFTLCW